MLLLAAWLVLVGTSCTDAYEDDAISQTLDEGQLRLTLPGVVYDDASTRADGEVDAEADERRVTSLWFMAYPTDNQGERLVQRLTPANEQLTHGYQTFDLRIKHGTYRIYVVANVPEIEETITEDELRKLLLRYKEGDPITLPSPSGNGLPMVYESEAPVSIPQISSIQADLVFACVKVRCTLVFDTQDVSSAFGSHRMAVTGLQARRVADQATLLASAREEMSLNLEPFDTELPQGAYHIGSYDSNQADSQFDQENIDLSREGGQWAYRTTFYLPEHYVTDADEQTDLRLHTTLYTEEGVKRAELAYTIQFDPVDNDTPALPRGTYYDITGLLTGTGDELSTTAAVQAWTLENVNIALQGPYYLQVDKTQVQLMAGDSATVTCSTDAERLTYRSPVYELNGKQVDIFQVKFNSDYTAFTIQVNPEIPPSKEIEEKIKQEGLNYILIRIPAGDDGFLLEKKIMIKPLQLEPYLIVTPPHYTVYISEISNQEEHVVTFTYRTNLPHVTVTTGGQTLSGTEYGPLSEKNAVYVTDSGLTDGVGTVTCRLDRPYVASHFTQTETFTFHYEASGGSSGILTQESTLTLIPNATKYRLHFRPVGDYWTNPHIYAYEVLYAPDGKEVRIKSNDGKDQGENAVLYGFTGMRTFKGWSGHGGDIQLTGEDKTTYWLMDNGWDPIHSSTTYYNTSIDYSKNFRKDCCATEVFPKWPGVKMKRDLDNPGWFYYDLPALANPGSTLIMFTFSHYTEDGSTIYGDQRYPLHLEPGVPLYDFVDKDGWFYYDKDRGNANEFVDDKPQVADLKWLRTGTYRIWHLKDGKIHIWVYDGTSDVAYKGYAFGAEEESLTYDSATGWYYYDIEVTEEWYPSDCQTIEYKFIDGANDESIRYDDWQPVTGQSYQYEVTR